MGKQVKKHGYSCKLDRVVDGDTCDAMVDLGFNVWHKVFSLSPFKTPPMEEMASRALFLKSMHLFFLSE